MKDPRVAPSTGAGGDLDSWRPEQGVNGRTRRLGVRVTLVLLALSAVVWLGFALFGPLANPDVHFVVVQPHPDADPLAFHDDSPLYVSDDLLDLETLGNDLHRYDASHAPVRLTGLNSPAEVRSLKRRLEELTAERSGVLILSLTLRGFTDDGDAYIRWPSRGPTNAPDTLRLDELLDQIATYRAPVKLLIVDLRDPNGSVADRAVIDAFPRLLQAAVEKTGDETLWVLASHSILERSHLDHARRRSLFSDCVATGLRGAADLDRDGAISVGELHRYVAGCVAGRLRASSGGRATQTPILCRGGGSFDSDRSPRLIPVLREVTPPPEREDGPLFPDSLSAFALQDAVDRATAENTPHPFVPPPPNVLGLLDAQPTDASRAEAAPATPGKPNGKADESRQPPAKPGSTADAKSPAPKADATEPAPKTTPVGEKEPPKNAKQTVVEKLLVARAWRDAVVRRNNSRPWNAVDEAPELLHELDRRLLLAERVYRTVGPFDPKAAEGERAELRDRFSERLDELIRVAEALHAGRISLAPTATEFEKRVAERLAGEPGGDAPAHSAAMLERRARRGAAPPPAVQSALTTLDGLILGGNESAFRSWANGLSDDLKRYSEFELAHRLASHAPAEWSDIRYALAVRRYGEQVAAAAEGAVEWVAPLVADADRERLLGERRLMDGIGSDFASWSRRRLQQSARRYFAAAKRIQQLHEAAMLRNDLLFELPSFLAWRRAAMPVADSGASRDLADLIATTSDLVDLLERPDPDRFERLAQTVLQLRGRRSRMREAVHREAVQPAVGVAAGAGAVAGDLQRFEAALQLSTLDVSERVTLLRGISRIAADASPTGELGPPPEPRTIGPADAAALSQRVDLLLAVGRLLRTADSQSDAWTELAAAGDRLKSELRNGGANVGLWRANRNFQSALAEVQSRTATAARSALHSGPAATGPEAWQTRRRELQHAERTARILPAATNRSPAPSPLPLFRRMELRELLVWQRERLLQAVQDAPRDETASLETAARRYGAALTADGETPPLQPFESASIVIRARESASLQAETSAGIAVQIRALSAATEAIPDDVQLQLEFDPAVFNVEPVNGVELTAEPRTNGSSSSGRAIIGAKVRATVGRPFVLPLQITRRIDARMRPAKIVVHASRGNDAVRRSIAVSLPQPAAVKLSAESPAGIGRIDSERNDGIVLHPFPNRETQFRFALRNLTGKERTVDVRLYAVTSVDAATLPVEEIAADAALELLNRFGATTAVAEQTGLKLPADDSPAALMLKKPKPADADVPPAKPPAGKPADPVVTDGMLAAVGDAATNRVTLRRIAFAPQRPRRYVSMRVSYDSRRRALSVRVAPRDRSWLPEGDVAVSAEIVGADNVEPLQGVLKPADSELTITGVVPPTQQAEATVHVHVDGFPRAFIYRVPLGRSSTDVPEDAARRGFRIIAPEPDSVFGKSAASVPVAFQVDSPVGSFEDPAEFVEIGLDVNRDRTLRNERTLRFTSDRQVAIGLKGVGEDGSLQTATEVRDFRIELPVAGAENRRVNVLGRQQTTGRSSWSESTPIVLDRAPPVVLPVEIARVMEGGTANVVVQTTDANLSGVARVEVLIDENRTGQFPPDAAPMAAEASPTGVWLAEISTGERKPGEYPLLIRAADRAGNVSDVVSSKMVVLSKQQAAAEANPPNRVAGVVTFDKEPVAGATATLSGDVPPEEGRAAKARSGADAGEPIPSVQTDDQGRFVFPKVPPGKYQLRVFKNAVAGKRRTATSAVEVPAAPKPVPIQQLKLN